LCWSGDDRPGPLIERAASWLVVNKVLLAGVSVVERFVSRVWNRAQSVFGNVLLPLSTTNRARDTKLCDETDTPNLLHWTLCEPCRPSRVFSSKTSWAMSRNRIAASSRSRGSQASQPSLLVGDFGILE
jgi:hypothetical protein